ncbi:G-type lectin S-receptor-like serine/threonine-protein kinase [Tripterygium wilfordii]|uniref:non-specific serine/threonine protein kinase n=1 Tax=Tripterygium wilfordii TaxID=458696 RepID=A0A7J7C341_TRIWF|nr:G-type lectin S-receptor-like serine/threonine-protein kinase [Tripterygium wilfordii]
MKGFTIFCFWFSLFCVFVVSVTVDGDEIPLNGTLKDGETIASSDGYFELGFVGIGGSKNRYLGIWYSFSNETIVWIANREAPLNDSSGLLKFTPQGVLQLLNSANNVVWNSSLLRGARNPVAQLLVTGNLVVKEANDDDEDNYLWQSFDYLTDTFLPAVKFGVNLVTNTESLLRSWISPDNPSPGNSTTQMDTSGYPQIFIRKGKDIVFRSGPWNGIRFSGMPNLSPNPIYTYEFVMNEREIYYRYDLTNSSVFTRMMLNNEGIFQRLTWTSRTQGWNLYLTAQMDNCDNYGTCGVYGSCDINNSPACECLKGFTPKYPGDWESGDWSGGCVMKSNMTCGDGEGFRRISSVKLPDTRMAWFNRTIDLRECELTCLRNCSCKAYSTLDISNGTGCLQWYGDLIDIREYTETGQDFFLKLPASELDTSRSSDTKRVVLFIVIPVVAMGFIFLGVYLLLFMRKKKLRREEGMSMRQIEREYMDESRQKDLELPLFDFTTIVTATKNFSDYNKLGEGGYGPVYKGTLKDGQEIAVKRLSKESTQGLDEFKNEVLCIAKLQHRNLVKLLGCCIQMEEKMLIYEYMPNKSLDAFIFGKALSLNILRLTRPTN